MSEETEVKPTYYEQCANAMFMMWLNYILTDDEYKRIMNKLFEAHKEGLI